MTLLNRLMKAEDRSQARKQLNDYRVEIDNENYDLTQQELSVYLSKLPKLHMDIMRRRDAARAALAD